MLKRTSTQKLDLNGYLSSVEESVLSVSAPTSIIHEITALQYALQEQHRYPIIRVERPVLASGQESEIPVVCNLTESRELTAAARGGSDHRTFAPA